MGPLVFVGYTGGQFASDRVDGVQASPVMFRTRSFSLRFRMVACATCAVGFAEAAVDFEAYDVASGCPGEESFLAEYRQVLGEPEAAKPERFSVEVLGTAVGYDGALSSTSIGFFRELSAESCEAVLTGLTLALAVYLETREEVRAPDQTPEPPSETERRGSKGEAESSELESPEERLQTAILLGSEFRDGVSPQAFPTVRLGLSLAELAPGWFGSYRLSAFGYYQPENRLVLLEGQSRQSALVHGGAGGSVHICPWLPELSKVFRIGPCGSLSIGEISIRSEPGQNFRRGWFGFAELGVVLEAHLAPWLVQVSAGTHAPLDRLVLRFEPGEPDFTQDDGFSTGLAVGLEL